MSKLAIMIAAAVLTLAAAPPNYTGMWKMDAARSDFGPVNKPESFIRTIEHNDPKLRVVSIFSSPQGDLTTDAKYTTDGKESVNQVRGGETRTVCTWDGGALVLNSRRKVEGGEIVTREKWTLSADGKVLTVASVTQSTRGEIRMNIVMLKQ